MGEKEMERRKGREEVVGWEVERKRASEETSTFALKWLKEREKKKMRQKRSDSKKKGWNERKRLRGILFIITIHNLLRIFPPSVDITSMHFHCHVENAKNAHIKSEICISRMCHGDAVYVCSCVRLVLFPWIWLWAQYYEVNWILNSHTQTIQ